MASSLRHLDSGGRRHALDWTGGNCSRQPGCGGTNLPYTLAFDLTADEALGGSFLGRYLVDNVLTSITLNGASLPSGYRGSSAAWETFSVSGPAFRAGQNELTFSVLNRAGTLTNPTGLRIECTDSTTGAVPEPASWAPMIIGFGAAGTMVRRRRPVVASA